jgi:hypothetical protein
VNGTLTNIILLFVFLLVYVFGTGYGFFVVWFKFPELQAKLIKRNTPHANNKWSLAYIANVWISHWSYKWFARIVTLLLLLIGSIALLATLVTLLNLILY